MPHHAPEATHLAPVSYAALVARGDFGGVEETSKVLHIVAPAPDIILETAHGTVFALPEKGSYHEQQRLIFEQVLAMVEAPDARKETGGPGSYSTRMDRRRKDQRVSLEDRLEVWAQIVFQGTDIGLRAEVGATAAGHEIKSTQVYEFVIAAALL